jgi:putative aldouronate transport system permease protein
MPEKTVRKKGMLKHDILRYKYMYLLFMPAFVFLAIFKYTPLYGIQIAFRQYRFADGIWGSKFVGFKYFARMFAEDTFLTVLRNTFVISGLRLLIVFPAGIILAIIFSEVMNLRFKKITQTISYLPHFVSWVVLAGIIKQLLSMNGVINQLVVFFGGKKELFVTDSQFFIAILILTDIWQSAGWGSIIFIAAISGINKELYEAANIDGASRMQRIIRITLPSLVSIISIMFLLRIGSILNAGFDQIFNLYTPLVYSVSDILDTYTYRVGLVNMDFSYSTAIGLFKNVVGVTLMLVVNKITKSANQYGI